HAGESALRLPHGLQVGEDLAGVELVGEGVDDGHGGAGGHLLDALLPRRPPHDGADLALQDAGGVGDGLAAAELAGARVHHQGVAAELGDAHGEGDPGPGGRLVEQHRDGPRALQRPEPEAVLLHLGGQVQHLGLLGGAQVVVTEEVPGHAHPPSSGAAASRIAGSASVNDRACSSVRISGGASRSATGATALTRKPASRAATSAAAACGPVRTAARHSPRPRTPASSGWPADSMPAARTSPTFTALASRPSFSIVVRTARAAATATGFPPNVLPWSPLASRAPCGPNATHAPIGRPPPSPFASVRTSGFALSSCWKANHVPVRPIPDWISSATNSAPVASQISRTAVK